MRQSSLHLDNQENKHKESGYELLAAAIVRKACEDYISVKKSPRGIYVVEKSILVTRESLLHFFHSPSYEILCKIDPKHLVNVLNKTDTDIARYYTSREKRGLL